MSLVVDVVYKGVPIRGALFTVETCTIQGGQLDFFVSMRAGPNFPAIDGQTHGCAYDESAGSPIDQAYEYLRTLNNPLEIPNDTAEASGQQRPSF